VKGTEILLLGAILSVSAVALAGGNKTSERVKKLIPELGAKSFSGRERAQTEIFRLFVKDSTNAVRAVAQGVASIKDPEVELRLNAILLRMAPDYVRLGQRGFLGVSLSRTGKPVKVGETTYSPIDIVNVLHGSCAKDAGITGGERILSVDDVDCTDDVEVNDIVRYISSRGPNGVIKLINLLPNKKVKMRVVVLGERPGRPGDPQLETIKKFMMEEWLKAEMRRAVEKVEPSKE
jgi:C-terminal processing protease CtpA/Prc